MFHPEVIAAAEARLNQSFGSLLPGGRLTRYPADVCHAMRDQLAGVPGAKGQPTRALTPAEDAFILNEKLLATIDYRYWSDRYAVIAKETQDAEPIAPRWASQDLFLGRLAALEYDHWRAGHPDGLLVNVLKARQLGVSTEIEVIVAHRATTQPTARCLVAGDIKEQSQYLMGMAELVIAHLPWWLCPPVAAHQVGDLWRTDTGALIRTAWGKSARGGLQDQGKTKGNLGRGKTYTVVHVSEYSTWERPEQIRDGLLPGIPARPRTFCAFESTAKGRYDAWHTHWLATARGTGRFTNIFIPWYIEPDKYWLPAPDGWEPSPTTRAHVDTVERTSGGFLLGRTVRLAREHAYWYERTRATFEEIGELFKFYEEYPATPEEAFQHAGRSVFSSTVLSRLATQETTPTGLYAIESAADLAQLRAWERAHPEGA